MLKFMCCTNINVMFLHAETIDICIN